MHVSIKWLDSGPATDCTCNKCEWVGAVEYSVCVPLGELPCGKAYGTEYYSRYSLSVPYALFPDEVAAALADGPGDPVSVVRGAGCGIMTEAEDKAHPLYLSGTPH